jgi:hypothetical protein
VPASVVVGPGHVHVHDEAWVRTLTLCCVHVHVPAGGGKWCDVLVSMRDPWPGGTASSSSPISATPCTHRRFFAQMANLCTTYRRLGVRGRLLRRTRVEYLHVNGRAGYVYALVSWSRNGKCTCVLAIDVVIQCDTANARSDPAPRGPTYVPCSSSSCSPRHGRFVWRRLPRAPSKVGPQTVPLSCQKKLYHHFGCRRLFQRIQKCKQNCHCSTICIPTTVTHCPSVYQQVTAGAQHARSS